MRPRYETELDTKNESIAIDRFVEWLGVGDFVVEVMTLDDRHAADYILLMMGERGHGTRVGFVEIKTRDFAFGTFETHFISKQKFDKLKALADLRFDVYILFALTDGLYYYQQAFHEPMVFEVKEGGRKDRADPLDIEPVVHIPNYLFRRV